MNHYTQIALTFWTLLFAAFMFYSTIYGAANKLFLPVVLFFGLLSFLSLFTALLAVGQYIN